MKLTACPRAIWRRFWEWLGKDATPRRRLVSFLMVAGASTWGFVVLQSQDDALKDQNNKTAAIVKAQEAERSARRVANAADKFSLCQTGNVAIGALDQVIVQAFQLRDRQLTGAEQAQFDTYVRSLRQDLDQRDCSVYLRDLTPNEEATVRATTIPPTIPRPGFGN